MPESKFFPKEKLSGPDAPWVTPFRKAGIDPWKLSRRDGFELFDRELEDPKVPVSEKKMIVESHQGPSNPQIDFWKRKFSKKSRMIDDVERAMKIKMLKDSLFSDRTIADRPDINSLFAPDTFTRGVVTDADLKALGAK